MLALIFSWFGLSVLTVALGAGAIGFALLGFRKVAMILAIVLAANLYSGIIYQQGVFEERAVWEAALKAEQDRQQAATDRADTLETALAAARTERDTLRAELGAANEAEIDLQAKLEEAEREAAIAAGGVPAPCVCTDSARDIERLYERLKR